MNIPKTIRVTLLAAVSNNRVIGNDGKIPWHIREDLQHFKEYTSGPTKVLLMGRKTWDSLAESKLPGRLKLVLTGNQDIPRIPEMRPVFNLEHLEGVLELLYQIGYSDLIVMGGQSLYELFLPIADSLILTEIDLTVPGDTFFPDFSKEDFEQVSRNKLLTLDNAWFTVYNRISPNAKQL